MVRSARTRGCALMICLILSLLVVGFSAAGVIVARASSRWFENAMDRTEVLCLAEGATELRLKDEKDVIDVGEFEF